MKVAKLMSLGLVFVIVLFQLVGCSTFTAAFEPKQAAKEYMRNLTTGDLEKVFEQVAYFDKGSDLEPEISFADAKQAWIDRVQRLKENGTYVKSYSNLKTWLDDGYPRGHVTLTVFYNGKETVQQKRPIHFARLHGKWKIQNIRLTDDSEGNDLQRALSGFMPPKKLDERTTVFQVNHLEFLNPRDPRKIATGERVKSQPDYSNILLESDRGSRALLQAGTFKELQQKVFEAGRYKGEDKPILYFAVDPMPVNEGKQIVYVSNKERNGFTRPAGPFQCLHHQRGRKRGTVAG